MLKLSGSISCKFSAGSRPHNITIRSAECIGDRESTSTPTTPTTPLAKPTSINPPSSPMRNQLKSPLVGTVPGSLTAAQPQEASTKEKLPKKGSSKRTITSSTKNQLPHSPKKLYSPTDRETHVFTTKSLDSSHTKQQLLPTTLPSNASSMNQPTSLVTTATTNHPKTQHIPASSSLGVSTNSAANEIKISAPSGVTQTWVGQSTVVSSNSKPAQSQLSSSASSTVAQSQASKQIVNSLSATALTRPPLRHQQKSSTTKAVTLLSNEEQQLKCVQNPTTVMTPTRAATPVSQSRNAQQSSATNVVGVTTENSVTSQVVLPQIQPVMSPDVSQIQRMVSSSSSNALSSGQTTVSDMQPQRILTCQAPLQVPTQPVIPLTSLPTVQQLQALSIMGALPMCNLPVLLQNANHRSLAANVNDSNIVYKAVNVATAQAVAATKPSEAHKDAATKVAPQLKSQQTTVSTSNSGSFLAQNKTGVHGTPCPSIVDSNPKVLQKNVIAVTHKGPLARLHTSAAVTTSTSDSRVILTAAQSTLHTPHKTLKHAERNITTNVSSNRSAKHLISETTQALVTVAHTNSSQPVSSNLSIGQKTANLTRTYSSASTKSAPMKKCSQTTSKQSSQPSCSNGRATTSANTSTSHQNIVATSPQMTIQRMLELTTSAKKVLSDSGRTTSSSSDFSHGSSYSSCSVAQNVSVSSKGVAAKPSIKEGSVPSSDLTTGSSSGEKVLGNTLLPSLLCSVCQHMLQNPLRSECCGTLYCELCSRRVKLCSRHKCQLRFKRDVELFNMIQKQITKCKYAGNGCMWSGLVAERKQHLSVCLYNPSSKYIQMATLDVPTC